MDHIDHTKNENNNTATRDHSNSAWEKEFVQKLASEAMFEQRKRRRWGIFFKLISFTYVGLFLFWSLDFGEALSLSGTKISSEKQPHVGLVQLDGQISADTFASAAAVNEGLQRAFENSHTVAVILKINSPGGSPVQAGLINDEIIRLREKFSDKPIYAVIEDVCASGGYYVAVAADAIYANKASLVGSIGVVMSGFGFTGTMEKLGVERRLITAGDNKGFLDPFSEKNPAQVEFAQELMGQIHTQFIDVVQKGRGDRLKQSDNLFSGLIWTGQQSLEMGLIDGLGSVNSVMSDVIKAEHVVDYTVQENLFERLVERTGVLFSHSLSTAFNRGAVPTY